MRKILVILIGLLLPAFCFGAVSYSRTPSGSEITSPVSFDVSFDDFDEIECIGFDFWSISVINFTSYVFNENYVYPNGKGYASTTLSGIFTFNLPVGYVATEIQVKCGEDEVGDFSNGGISLEGDGGSPIFEVVAGEEGAPSLFTFPSDFVPQTGDTVKDYIFDLYPFLALIVGTLLFFWIVSWTLDKISSKK